MPGLVIRQYETRLQHPAPDSVDVYVCRYPNGEELTAYRQDVVRGIPKDRQTFAMEKDSNGVHSGRVQMHLVPGQPSDGEVRCKAGKYVGDRSLLFDMNAYREWKVEHPDEEPSHEILWSDWSNPRPLGEVQPDPVPEPGILLLLALGVLGLVVAGWRQRIR